MVIFMWSSLGRMVWGVRVGKGDIDINDAAARGRSDGSTVLKFTSRVCGLNTSTLGRFQEGAAHRDTCREWNVSKQKWNLC